VGDSTNDDLDEPIVDIALPRPRGFEQEGDPAFHAAVQRIRHTIYQRLPDAA